MSVSSAADPRCLSFGQVPAEVVADRPAQPDAGRRQLRGGGDDSGAGPSEGQDTTDGGVFTKALIDGLKGKAKPDAITKRLYVHHLFTYTFDTVASQTGYKQMPLYLPSGSVPPIVLKVANSGD